MNRHAILCFVYALVAFGCDLSEQTSASTTAVAPTRGPIPSATEEVARATLNADINSMTKRVRSERSLDLASNLVGSLLLRQKFYGGDADLMEAQRVAEVTLDHEPGHPAALLLRAEAHHAVAEYGESRVLIDKARAQLLPGALSERTRMQLLGRALDLEISNAIETGRALDKAVERLEKIIAAGHSYGHVNKLAAAYAKLGRFEEADTLYAGAVTTKGEVTPFLLAWVAYLRGQMWLAEAKRPERARPHLEKALGYMPEFVAARVALNKVRAAR